MRMQPDGSAGQIREQSLTIRRRQRFAQSGDSFRCDVRFPEIAESCQNQSTSAAGGCNAAWRGRPQFDQEFAELNLAGAAAGQKYHLGRDLLREPEQICRIGPGRLEFDLLGRGQRVGHGFDGRCYLTQEAVTFRVVIEASGNPADGARLGEAMQRSIYRPATSQIQKVVWSENATPAPAIDSASY